MAFGELCGIRRGRYIFAMAYFPRPHPSQRARRHRVGGPVSVLFLYGEGYQNRGRLFEVSQTGGSADMDVLLPPATLVYLTIRTENGPIAAIAEMLPALGGNRQPFRFIALEERDSDGLRRLLAN